MELHFNGKSNYHIFESTDLTPRDYAWREGFLSEATTAKWTLSEPEADKGEAIARPSHEVFKFGVKAGYIDEEVLKKFNADAATVQYYITISLDPIGKELIKRLNLLSIKQKKLHIKYSSVLQTLGNYYFIKITNYKMGKARVHEAWTKLCEYRRKAVQANSALAAAVTQGCLLSVNAGCYGN